MFKLNDVIQFNEKHKWCGTFGFIHEIKEYANDIRYMIAIPIPSGDGVGTAFIFSMHSDEEFDYIGHTNLVIKNEEE